MNSVKYQKVYSYNLKETDKIFLKLIANWRLNICDLSENLKGVNLVGACSNQVKLVETTM